MIYYFIFFSIVLLATFAGIGYYVSKSVNSDDSYFLADRKLGIASVCMSLLATQIGGGAILGVSNFSYKYGIYGIFYSLGLSLGLIAVSIFGAKQLREKNISTIAELFEKEYKSKFLRKIASIISIISLYGILISLIIGTRKMLVAFGIENELILYAFWIILILYTVLGGLKAVVYTDVVQIIFIFAAFILITGYYFFYKHDYIQFSIDNLFNSIVNRDKASLTPYLIVPFLYVFIEQDMAQRFFSAKNSKTAYISAFLAGILLLIFSFIPVIFGIAARKIANIPVGSNEMIYFFITTSNNFIISITTLAILCAIISTGDSLLCAITSNISLDFKKKNSSINLLHTRITTGLLGFFAIIIANFYDNIIEMMLVSYEIMVCTLFFPIVISYFNFKKSTLLAYISIFLGVVGFVIHPKLSGVMYISISKELFCIFLSFFSLPLLYIYKKFR